MNLHEARAAWQAHQPELEARGFYAPYVQSYYPDGAKKDWTIALDAQPTLGTDPNSALPSILTTFIDPELVRWVFAPLAVADLYGGETKRGDWLQDSILFPVVEHTGEVAPYGDDANSGSAGLNMNWPERQPYLLQIVKQYGQRSLERAGLAKIDYVSEIDKAAVDIQNRFLNFGYAFGVAGLANYGAFNDPGLTSALTPGPKANGNGNTWFYAGLPNASSIEVYNDVMACYQQLVKQTQGNVTMKDEFTLGLPPGCEAALGFTNGFLVNTRMILKENFPNLTVKTVPQLGAASSINPQGISAGNMMQLIIPTFEGIKTAIPAFSEKNRTFPIVKEMSSFRQKSASGFWGTIIRRPMAIATMVGI